MYLPLSKVPLIRKCGAPVLGYVPSGSPVAQIRLTQFGSLGAGPPRGPIARVRQGDFLAFCGLLWLRQIK